MLRFKATDRLLLAVAVVYCSGCAAECCHLPDDIAYALCHCQLGREIEDVCRSLDGCHSGGCGNEIVCGDECGCGVRVYEDAVWLDEPPCYEACDEPCYETCRQPSCESCVETITQRRVERGPPPVSYVPPMPPKFLPVPTRSVFSNSGVAYPHSVPGQVEVGYGAELAFPAGDR